MIQYEIVICDTISQDVNQICTTENFSDAFILADLVNMRMAFTYENVEVWTKIDNEYNGSKFDMYGNRISI